MKKFLWSAIALIVISNSFVLARVIYNRQAGEPVVLKLTERELRLPYQYGNRLDNGGISLRLNWQAFTPHQKDANKTGSDNCTPYNYNNSDFHLTEELAQKLDVDITNYDKDNKNKKERFYNRPSKKVWLVLEMDGESYQQYLLSLQTQINVLQTSPNAQCSPIENEHKLHTLHERLRAAQTKESRLFVVDMAKKRHTLERLFKDQSNVIIVPGLVHISQHRDQPTFVHVNKLLAGQIHVPLMHRNQVIDLEAWRTYRDETFQPRYEADVAFGALGEPWIWSLRKL